MPDQTLTITLYAQGDAIATAAVIKLLLDWLLPLGLVYETALLTPHMRYRRISEPTREVFRIPHAGVPMGPTCQWQHRSSGRRGCNQPRCSRASATPDQALDGGKFHRRRHSSRHMATVVINGGGMATITIFSITCRQFGSSLMLTPPPGSVCEHGWVARWTPADHCLRGMPPGSPMAAFSMQCQGFCHPSPGSPWVGSEEESLVLQGMQGPASRRARENRQSPPLPAPGCVTGSATR